MLKVEPTGLRGRIVIGSGQAVLEAGKLSPTRQYIEN